MAPAQPPRPPPLLKDVVDAPRLTPAQEEAAKTLGISFRAFDPEELRALLLGHRTLAELQGVPKLAQLEWARQAQELLTRGQLAKALELFRGLVVLDPFDAWFHTGLGVCLFRDDQLEEALAHLSRALEINPYSIDARASRAELYAARGARRESLQDLVQLVNDNPDSREPAVEKARALIKNAAAKAK